MESQEGSQVLEEEQEDTTLSKDDPKPRRREIEDSEEDEPDETLAERLWGLTEMFPESVRNATACLATTTKSGVKSAYSFSRSAFWVVFSSSIILFAPVIFEVERAQMEEMQRSQQKQMLLGPNSAISGGVPPPLMPPPQR
ncbi:mitochondrial import receptor subunit TOM22 homolog isoform X2 [Aethina tumida]|nr:mitochondrial import receptor subunit TOM22 homolog isoform X2 [Aethina tumida]